MFLQVRDQLINLSMVRRIELERAPEPVIRFWGENGQLITSVFEDSGRVVHDSIDTIWEGVKIVARKCQ